LSRDYIQRLAHRKTRLKIRAIRNGHQYANGKLSDNVDAVFVETALSVKAITTYRIV